MKKEKQIIGEFEKLYPLVKVICVDNEFFAYDAKTGLLTEVCLDDLQQYVDGTLCGNVLFASGKQKKIVPDDSDIASMAQNQRRLFLPRKFVLEITEECTLRCKYCFFSDSKNQRKHSFMKMDESTAFKAIDYYFNLYTNAFSKILDKKKRHILNVAPPSLSWWGGEPFTNFKLILKTKEYFDSLPWKLYGIDKEDIIYSVVTNFTILNKEIVDFLVSTNLFLFISLDGNKEENDMNRVFEDGHGSYDIVYKNINYMVERFPDFCRERIIIQSVLADNVDRKSALMFLRKDMKMNTPDHKVLKIIGYPQRNKYQCIPKTICNKIEEKNILSTYKLLLDKIEKFSFSDIKTFFCISKDIEQEIKDVMSMEKLFVFDDIVQSKESIKHFSCPIGIDNIFISVNGDIHICNKTDYSYPLGNVYNGIDVDIVKNFYSSFYELIRKKCSGCWAIHFCNICPAGVLNDGKFILPSEIECKHIKKEILVNMKKFIILLHNEKLYEKIEKYIQGKEVSYLNYDGPINIENFS